MAGIQFNNMTLTGTVRPAEQNIQSEIVDNAHTDAAITYNAPMTTAEIDTALLAAGYSQEEIDKLTVNDKAYAYRVSQGRI